MKKLLTALLLLACLLTTVFAAEAPVARVVLPDGTAQTYTSFTAALANTPQKGYLQLLADVTATDKVTGELYLDLNGHTLRGITIEGTLYGMDSATDDYTDGKAGKLYPAAGAPAAHVKTTTEQVGFVRRYLAVQKGNAWRFARYYMGITKVALNPETVGVGYKATFAGNVAFRTQMRDFGYRLWVEERQALDFTLPSGELDQVRELTLLVEDFLRAELGDEENGKRAATKIYAQPYIRLTDGTELCGSTVSYDFRRMLELMMDGYEDLSASRQEALQALGGTFSNVMTSWDVSYIHHADGSRWEPLTKEILESKLTKSGSTYLLPSGNYVLTEDITLKDKTMKIVEGAHVDICLNGHTFSTNKRLFEQYGTLNICDCHKPEQEGAIVSSLISSSATYASIAYCRYTSVTNIYGGTLKATGKVTSAGLLAISHDGSGVHASKPSAVLNVYGGRFEGGFAKENGGLISAWNGATVNIYDGTFTGGHAEKRGGAIDVSSASGKLNIYGGTFSGNSGAHGGAVSVYSGTGSIYGGVFEDNTASEVGGAIHFRGTSGEHVLGDVTISGNSAVQYGSGVYVDSAKLKLVGDSRVTGNEKDDIYVNFYSVLNVDGLKQNARVGLRPEAMMEIGTDKAVISCLYSNGDDYTIRESDGKVLALKKSVNIPGDVSGFQVGFGETNITPEVIDGMPLAGYSNSADRLAVDEGRKEYDDIKCQSVAITDENGTTVILIYADLITYNRSIFDNVLRAVAVATGVPQEHIFVNLSHSHSVPSITTTSIPAVVEYNRTLPNLFAESALQAMNDRAPATMETGSFEAKAYIEGRGERYLNFYRHYYHVENDIVKYFGDCFGTAVYNGTTEPVGEADHTMHLVRFTREGKDILMSNFRMHPHRTGGETKYKLSSDIIGTLRYYMQQKMPDAHFVYFQGAAGNNNSVSRLTKYNHGLDYVAYGNVLAQCIVDNLGCLEDRKIGNLQVDHYEYLAKADVPSAEEYAKAKEVYDIFVVETAGMGLGAQNEWVQKYCKEHPEYNFASAFQLSFTVNRRYNQKDTYLPLNTVTLGKHFGFFTAPGEMWDTISVAVEEGTTLDTVFCLGYSMDHQHYMVYYPDYVDMPNGVPYVSYESENRHFVAPKTVQDMINYWITTLQEMSQR